MVVNFLNTVKLQLMLLNVCEASKKWNNCLIIAALFAGSLLVLVNTQS